MKSHEGLQGQSWGETKLKVKSKSGRKEKSLQNVTLKGELGGTTASRGKESMLKRKLKNTEQSNKKEEVSKYGGYSRGGGQTSSGGEHSVLAYVEEEKKRKWCRKTAAVGGVRGIILPKRE